MSFVCSLANLSEFIRTVDKGLTCPVVEGDYTGLVDVSNRISLSLNLRLISIHVKDNK